MVTAIIPAYNEGPRIAAAVRGALSHESVYEVIVVDDGSIDATSAAARQAGARVIRFAENSGKAAAMNAGVSAASHDVVLFLDADVAGFDRAKIGTIIEPVISGGLDMHVGIMARRVLFTKKVFYVLPVLSGMRALRKELWQRVDPRHRRGFRIELALNHAARKHGKGTGYEIIDGLSHVVKERKYGLFSGLYRRARMIGQLVAVSTLLYVWEPLSSPFRKLRKQSSVGFN